ncbi:MAG: sugar phosphate isomerase/epimerase [Oscillospiraceae bacterium]|nr:sugar phosphate isomerase/epimerase [Oscillospiraceae bacterium]
MKIGCCVNLLARGHDRIGIDWVETIAEIGYDYVELPLARVMELSDDDFDALCERIKRAGIPCRSCCNLFPGDEIRVTGRNVDIAGVRAYLEKAFSRARRLGACVVVFGSPAARDVEEGFPREIAMLQFIKALQIMDEYAGDGLTVVIEHVCKLEGNIIYTVEEGCMLRDICRAENITVLADTYHMFVEGEPIENISLAGKYLKHVHTANPIGRVYPKAGDGVDYKHIFDTLKSIGYDGGISVEAFSDDPANDARAALEVLRQADA